ncbi:unnamed protein product [Diabrotica balteata]|uniref:Uncharacterized protein n=1 Tax=Diabrotica balteata TaxID=107213 RepID=A0A9N9T2Z2_DIABA|nr:unnamed protein product [Diabrotica balteata]
MFIILSATFTPGAQELRIQDLPKRKKKVNPSPLGEDDLFLKYYLLGKLRYPPKKSRKQIEQEELLLEQHAKKVDTSAFVDIIDLLSGDYHRRKEAERVAKQKELKMKRKTDALKMEGYSYEKERGYFANLINEILKQSYSKCKA